MKLSDFKYDLPSDLIAQYPQEKRDQSRLMVLDRKTETIETRTFSDILDYLNEGDCLVINETKVFLSFEFSINDSRRARSLAKVPYRCPEFSNNAQI